MDEAIKTLAAMKAQLHKSLDRAPKGSDYETAWEAYKDGSKTIADISESLPLWAKIQFEQIGELYRLFKLRSEESRLLTLAVEEAYHDGLKAGLAQRNNKETELARLCGQRISSLEFIAHMGMTVEALKNIRNKEYHRRLSLEKARLLWSDLY